MVTIHPDKLEQALKDGLIWFSTRFKNSYKVLFFLRDDGSVTVAANAMIFVERYKESCSNLLVLANVLVSTAVDGTLSDDIHKAIRLGGVFDDGELLKLTRKKYYNNDCEQWKRMRKLAAQDLLEQALIETGNSPVKTSAAKTRLKQLLVRQNFSSFLPDDPGIEMKLLNLGR